LSGRPVAIIDSWILNDRRKPVRVPVLSLGVLYRFAVRRRRGCEDDFAAIGEAQARF
jgi:hypothetical protein